MKCVHTLLWLSLIVCSCNRKVNTELKEHVATATQTNVAAQLKAHINSSDSALQIGKKIQCIFQDKAGNFWFAFDGEGVCRYDGTSFKYFTKSDGLCSQYVHTVQEDKDGKIWFETGEGICRYDPEYNSFTAFTGYSSTQKIDTAYDWQRAHDDLWFGGREGAYRFHSGLFTYHPFPKSTADLQKPENPSNPLSASAVYCMYKDKSGALWFGTQTRGVCRYDGKSFTWFSENGVAGPAVRAIFEDESGNMWFGNNGFGLIRYNGKTLTNFTNENGLGNAHFLRHGTVTDTPGTLARVWTIQQDNTGAIWFGTIDAGAWRYDGKTMTNFTTKDGLTSNAVTTIYNDADGNLWFGTDGGGVCLFNGKSFVNVTR